MLLGSVCFLGRYVVWALARGPKPKGFEFEVVHPMHMFALVSLGFVVLNVLGIVLAAVLMNTLSTEH